VLQTEQENNNKKIYSNKTSDKYTSDKNTLQSLNGAYNWN